MTRKVERGEGPDALRSASLFQDPFADRRGPDILLK